MAHGDLSEVVPSHYTDATSCVNPAGRSDHEDLFDLRRDPSEKYTVAHVLPDDVREALERPIAAHRSTPGEPRETRPQRRTQRGDRLHLYFAWKRIWARVGDLSYEELCEIELDENVIRLDFSDFEASKGRLWRRAWVHGGSSVNGRPFLAGFEGLGAGAGNR